jgi:hypothetical protein
MSNQQKPLAHTHGVEGFFPVIVQQPKLWAFTTDLSKTPKQRKTNKKSGLFQVSGIMHPNNPQSHWLFFRRESCYLVQWQGLLLLQTTLPRNGSQAEKRPPSRWVYYSRPRRLGGGGPPTTMRYDKRRNQSRLGRTGSPMVGWQKETRNVGTHLPTICSTQSSESQQTWTPGPTGSTGCMTCVAYTVVYHNFPINDSLLIDSHRKWPSSTEETSDRFFKKPDKLQEN